MAEKEHGKRINSRIIIIQSDMPFEFKRIQFTVRLAFAMTINKAKGQSLEVCELNLETPCFPHGQLYVGCLRKGKTKNIVYQKVLQ